ncbi:replicative DNA helicase [Nitrospinae bacterium AH_259_B05_G02_I21]|nr:replicative DNA helicase [Nitrospinae bacterium AH_259_B05_G02_I21]
MAITDQVLDRMPPQSLEAEQAVLGAVLRDSEALSKALEILDRQNFYRESHRLIFDAMCELFEQGEPIDLLTLQERLRLRDRLEAAGGVSYLSQLIDMTPTAGHVRHHAKIIREKAILRGLIHVATEIVSQSYEDTLEVEEVLDQAEKSIFAISEQKITPSFKDTYTLMKESLKEIEVLFEKKQYVTGVPTGFIEFDEMTAGLQAGDLIIIAGRPSAGKTAFVLNIAQHAASAKGIGVAIFSLEMSKSQLGIRLLCSEARISSTKLRTGRLSKKDWGPLSLAAGNLAEVPIFIDDTAVMTDLEIRAKSRRIMAEQNIGLIIVDYLQLVRGRDRHESRHQEVSDVTRSLKALAKELDVPVIAVSQLSRAVEQRQGKRPQLSDLRESGAIEQDADLVAFVHRRDVSPSEPDEVETDSGVVELIIGKQRNGPTGMVKLAFLKEFARFENLSRRMEPA